MPVTILGPSSSVPYSTYPTLVQIAKNWPDAWKTVPGLTLETASRNAGGNDLDSAVFTWKYGTLRHPWDTAAKVYKPLSIDGYWVQVLLAGGKKPQVLWTGRIYGQGRQIFGAQGGPSGVQRWQAYGPQMILRKMHISQSVWQKPAGAGTLAGTGDNIVDWVPPMNDRIGQQALLIGNRSSAQVGPSFSTQSSYVFGGTDIWSALDYLNYLLVWWLDFSQSTPAGPIFKLAGQTTPLQNLKFCQEWPEITTADHILRTLISPKLGLDYTIDYSADQSGFTINVFSLQAQAVSAGGVTLPANSNTVRVKAGATPANLKTQVAISNDHRVRGIRVHGKRIVVCCTLEGPDAAITDDSRAGMLAASWDTLLETDYDAGTGPAPTDATGANLYPAGSAERADLVRRDPRFRDVYQLWLMPTSVDLQSLLACPMVDARGNPSAGTTGTDEPPRQMQLRKTLHWLPLRSDYDYTSWPPTQLTLATDPDYATQYLPPQCWLPDTNGYYRPAALAGVHVAAPRHGLGVRLTCHPRHLVGLGEFTATAPTAHQPRYNAGAMVATLAFEADARIALEYKVPNGDDVDGWEEIEIPDAEMWLIAPNTYVALANPWVSGAPFTPSPDALTILRDDRPRLGMVLAGAIARYASSRARAEIEAAGICPWGGLLGQILTTIESGGASTTVQSPITQITWSNATDGGTPRTTVRTGFASRE
jgi:hypothetical protein